MPRSMTGFGVADGSVAGGRLQIEIRTVNHRHFSTQIRVPRELTELEAQLRDHLRASIDRGHVLLQGRWTEDPPKPSELSVDLNRARDVLAACEELKLALDLKGELDVGFIARQPEVLSLSGTDAAQVEGERVVEIVDAALSSVLEMRAGEGEALATELNLRLTEIEGHLSAVEQRAPERLVTERDRLRKSAAELMEGRQLNDDRLAQEIALLADRLDITEEIVRLRAHIGVSHQAIAGEGPVGKQLGFLSQEMLREINTIGSKANDADIAHAVVAMKGALEKFREQVENVE